MLISGLFLATVLTGCFCTQKVEVLPKSLPNATLGNPYYAKIKVAGGVVIDEFFTYHINPVKSGLELSPTDFGTKYVSFNDLKVKGDPRQNIRQCPPLSFFHFGNIVVHIVQVIPSHWLNDGVSDYNRFQYIQIVLY